MKQKKLLIDILLFFTLLIAFISGVAFTNTDLMAWLLVHIISSIIFVVLLVNHLRINTRGWFDAGKKFFIGRKYKEVRWKYVTDWLLLIIWTMVFISGFPAMGYKMGGNEFLFPAGKAHGILSIIGAGLIAIHIFQHRKQIKTYFKK